MFNMNNKTIMWFRQDLRLHDNPALLNSVNSGFILPVYIYDTTTPEEFIIGAASKVWLHHAINSLNQSLDSHLQVFIGDPKDILLKLIKKHTITQINWNRCYEKWQVERDTNIKQILHQQCILVNSFNGSLLWEPWEALKSDGTPYKVFTPFYHNGCLTKEEPRKPLPKPQNIKFVETLNDTQINDIHLLPQIPWDKNIIANWQVSEDAALSKLHNFIENKIHDYKIGRDCPAHDFTSKLSPYLHFGQISPNTAWYIAKYSGFDNNIDIFLSELGWREFSYSLLYYFPDLHKENWQKKFDNFPWQTDISNLQLWQSGKTGIPIVDAGMRELWQTGHMHNRVRMIVASFLIKNLLIDWRHGARWFWNTLFDADLASNSASWQWVAGLGADAAPYFRIFNPVTQSQKFDLEGIYIRKYIPELKSLPNKYLFSPWAAPAEILSTFGVVLGQDYPFPIVDLKESREIALQGFKSLGNVISERVVVL